MKNKIEIEGCTELSAKETQNIVGGTALIEDVLYAVGWLLGRMGKIQRGNPYNPWIV